VCVCICIGSVPRSASVGLVSSQWHDSCVSSLRQPLVVCSQRLPRTTRSIEASDCTASLPFTSDVAYTSPIMPRLLLFALLLLLPLRLDLLEEPF